jgi:hypothetical protein
MPIFLLPFLIAHAKMAHAADRQVDVARQEYALHVAEFNMKYHTNVVPTKKGVIVYDPKTGTVDNQDVNDVHHRAGHKTVSQVHSDAPARPSKVQ